MLKQMRTHRTVFQEEKRTTLADLLEEREWKKVKKYMEPCVENKQELRAAFQIHFSDRLLIRNDIEGRASVLYMYAIVKVVPVYWKKPCEVRAGRETT